MARKRKQEEEYQVFNGGGVGYSQAALDALTRGNYGSSTNRKVQYHTSQEQTQQAKSLPVLKGISVPETNNVSTTNNRKSYIDTDRARRNYANRLTESTPKTTSSDENYVVKRDRYDKLMQNSRLADDIRKLAMVNYSNANQDATVSEDWANEYGAKKITGGYSKKQFLNTLSRRYDLTTKELEDMALTFHSDANKAENAKYGQDLEKLGKEHSVLGSAGSLVGTLGSGVEGAYNTVVGGITGDDRYLSNMFRTTKNSLREGAKKNIKSDFGKGAYDVGMGVADMVAGAAAGSAPVILAGNTANEAMNSAIDRGSSVRKSATYGAAAGALDFITNKIGLDKAKKLAVDSIKITGIKKFLAQNAIAGLGEAGENVLQDLGQSVIDNIVNGKNSELRASYEDKVANGMSGSDAIKAVAKEYAQQVGMSGLIGFGMGSAMQGGSSLLPKVPELYGKIKNGKIEKSISKNADIQNILDGKVPEVTSGADIQKAQAQQAKAVENIQKLSEQIPETRTTLDENYDTVAAKPSSMDYPHQLADRLAQVSYDTDTYGYMDDIQEIDGFVEQIADDISKGKDLTPYISKLEDDIYDAPNEQVAAEMQSLIDELSQLQGERAVNTPAPENKVPMVDDQTRRAELEREMNEKVAKLKEEVGVNKVVAESRKQNPRIVKKLEGAELEEAKKKIDFNKREINGLEQKKQAIVNGKGNKRNGKLTKAAKAEVKAIDDQINKLKSENKPIQRQIDGKPTPIKELMTDDEREAIFSEQYGIYKDLNYAVRFAGNTDEAKTLRKEAKALLGKYIESNDTADLREFYNKVIELDNLAKEVDSEYVTGSGVRNTYDDYFESQGERDIPHVVKKIMATRALQAVPDAHGRLETEAISAPEVPAETMPETSSVQSEQARINDFMSKKVGKNDSIELENGQVLEKYSMKEMKSIVKDAKENGLPEGYQLDIRYKDGSEAYYSSGDDTSKIKMSNIDSVVWRNDSTDAYAGNNVSIYPDDNAADNAYWHMTLGEAPETQRAQGTPETPVEEVPAEPIETPVDNGGNVPPNEPPLVTDSEGTDNMGRSRVVKHTGINSGVVDAYEYENDPVIQEIATYAKHSNEKTFNNALDNVRKNGTKLLDEYNSDRRIIDNDQDVDQAMLLLRNLKEQIRNASPEEAEALTVQKNMLLSRLRETGTKYGQAIQAFAKWNDTSEGALINGDGFLRDATDTWKSQNKEQVDTNEKIAEDLDNIGREEKVSEEKEEKKPESQRLKNALNSLVEEDTKPERQELSKEELRERVKNTLDNEAASVAEFTDEDIDYITNLMQNGANKQELAEALNRKMATGRFGVSQDTQTKVNQLFEYADKYDPNSKEAVEAKAAAYKLIADEVVGKASPFEKFEAWRYLAMLGNPKTMLRNFVGNTMFNAVTSASNSLSAVMEAAVDKTSRALGGKGIQRTKSVLIPSLDSKLIKGAWEDAPAKRYKQLTGTKYEKSGVRKAIASQKSVFDSKFLKLYEQAVDKGISDYPAIRTKYSTSLAGWMKANGLDESAFDAESKYYRLKNLSDTRVLTDAERAEMSDLKQTMDALEKGRDYALKQAEYATFHEDNAIADAFSRGSRYLLENDNKAARALGYMMEGIVPFKKTPANILRSGIEYSPLGAIKSLKDTGKLIYENTGKRKNNLGDTYTKKSWWRGNESEVNRTLASDVIDDWSKTLTGTGLAMLGYYLKSKGVLNSSESDEKYQDDLEGIQNYSLTINGKTYTLDWAAPAVMPLLLGAEVKKINEKNAIPDEKWYSNPDEIIGSINALLDPIFETSMLQGIQNVMESAANEIKYNDDGAIGGILGSATMNALTGYGTQALPTISGQVARTIDNTRRTTDTASDSNFVSGIEKQVRKLANKVPVLSKFVNTPYYDAYGRSQTNSPSENPIANLAYQMLSPAYIRDINTTAADTMARNVYNAPDPNDPNGRPIQDKNVFAPWKGKVNVDGVKLTPEEMATYRQTSGQASYAIRDALNKEQWFNELDGNKQTEVLHKVNTLVDKIGKEATGHPQDSDELTAYNEGGIPSLLDKLHDTQLNKMLKEAGVSTSSNLAKEVKAEIKAGNADAAMKAIEQSNQLKAEAQNAGFVNKDGKVNTEQYQKVIKQAGAQSDKMVNDLPALQKTGLEKSAYYYYAHAINVHPELTVNEFARQYKEINTNTEDKLTQKEMLNYINSYQFSDDPNEDQAMVLDLWNTYNDGSWKKVPYVKKDGTYGAK